MPQPSFVDPPFACPPDAVEITLDLPVPPSANRIWRHARGHVYKTQQYTKWQQDAYFLAFAKDRPRVRITGPFSITILLARAFCGDADNRIKPILDWLQAFNFIRNDKDCEEIHCKWVPVAMAPQGVRVTVRASNGLDRGTG